jgi:ubiquinone/menaquinone biosynthesis C-methylase UbiE/DNA-binding transcriptional ArsR family regulator
MKSASALYRLLGDEARLRLLRLLARERLNVSELTAILGLAQSGVSRHLGLLKDAGLVAESRDGGYAYYQIAPDARAGARHAGIWPLLEAQFATASDRAVKADDARLQEVLRLRKENFEAHAAAERKGQLVPGKSWAAWSRALGHLLPPLVVADLGCGEGYLTVEAARWAKRVVAVDRSEAVLRQARALARRRRVRNVIWKRGEIERLPMADASVDVALLSQALHHAVAPARALAEAARVVAPGGRVVVLDLRVHDQTWVRDRLGDQWLGFQDGELERLMKDAGLADVKVGVGARKAGDPFTVLVASGRKPAAKDEAAKKTKRDRR